MMNVLRTCIFFFDSEVLSSLVRDFFQKIFFHINLCVLLFFTYDLSIFAFVIFGFVCAFVVTVLSFTKIKKYFFLIVFRHAHNIICL